MRTQNREINIFNMSLLDILTGMLGAFLFLMLGLVPYYSKVVQGTVISEEDKRKLDELKKLLDKGLKGPLSPEEVEQLRAEMDRVTRENQQLHGENEQLQTNLKQTEQDLQKITDFWATQSALFGMVCFWDSGDADIDIMVLGPDGTIYGPKQQKVLGKDVFPEGVDSHRVDNGTPYKGTIEVSSVSLHESGDYLVFYRVPNNAPPAAYAGLTGLWEYQNVVYDPKHADSGFKQINGGSLGDPKAPKAKPGGLYAWIIINYDASGGNINLRTPGPNLPAGIQLPQ